MTDEKKKEIKNTTAHLNAYFHKKLIDIVDTRVNKHHPFKTKQAIIEQLIEAAHKKECK